MGCIHTKATNTSSTLMDEPHKLRIKIPKDDLDNTFRPLQRRLLRKISPVVPSIKRRHE